MSKEGHEQMNILFGFNAHFIYNCNKSAKYWNIISFKELLSTICIVTGDIIYHKGIVV
jgi:hypothetical protein